MRLPASRQKPDGKPYSVLVLNAFSRNALAVIEGLGADFRLAGGCAGGPMTNLRRRLLLPNTVKTLFEYTNPEVDSGRFKADLVAAIRTFGADCVVPAGTEVTNALSILKEEVEATTTAVLLVETPEPHFRLADKWRTYELCVRLGIPVPEAVEAKSVDAVLSAATNLLPCVCKPKDASASAGVFFFHSAADVSRWNETCPEELLPTPENPCIVQRFIRGELHDATAYAIDGEAVALLTQQRMVTMADFGGGGIVNLTTDEPQLREYARQILRDVGWNGVCEFDFIKDDTGSFFLLECNPKFWGTTDLTVQAGLNIPQIAVDHQLLGRRPPPEEAYEVGLLYRWILPTCTNYWVSEPRTLSRVAERVKRTFASHGAKRTINQIRWGSLLGPPLRAALRLLPKTGDNT